MVRPLHEQSSLWRPTHTIRNRAYFFEVSPLVWELIQGYRSGDPEPSHRLSRRYPRRELRRSLQELQQTGILQPADSTGRKHQPKLRKRAGIRHLELMVTHACNMRCRYCYGSEDHDG